MAPMTIFGYELKLTPFCVCQNLLALLMALAIHVEETDAAVVTCLKNTNCKCTLSDNTYYYDLAPLVQGVPPPFFSNVQGVNSTFMYDPCRSFSITMTTSECSDVAMCRESPTMSYFNLGRHNTSEFVYIAGNEVELRINYNNGKTGDKLVRSTVQLICDTNGISHVKLLQSMPTNYLFELRSKYSCKKPVPPHPTHLSPGGIICIIFVVVVTVYFAGGFVYLFFFKFESGTKAIPHYDFWSSLPGLIRDGCLFCCSSICNSNARMMRTGPSYDAI